MSEESNRSTKVESVLDILEIQKVLPHRYPFLLVDRIVDLVPMERVVGIKNVTMNEPFFQGHFPDQPIMPGVMQLEALAQLGIVFSRLTSDSSDPNSLIVFAGVDDVRFRRKVVPGDILTLQMSLIKRRGGIWKMQGIAKVGDEVAVEGTLISGEVNPDY